MEVITYDHGVGGTPPSTALTPRDLLQQSYAAAAKDVPSKDKALVFMRQGFSAVYGNCATFFDSKGAEQQWLEFAKDLITVALPLATGVAGLSRASSNLITGIGLGGAASTAVLSSVERNFLFSTDNVGIVQDLVLRGINQQAQDYQALADKSAVFNIADATIAVFTVQATCQPGYIITMVRQAITNGKIVSQTAAQSVALLLSQDDLIQADRIAGLLHAARPLSDQQLAGLYWVFVDRRADITKGVASLLGDLRGSVLNDDGSTKANLNTSGLRTALLTLSADAKGGLEKLIDSAAKPTVAVPVAAPGDAVAAGLIRAEPAVSPSGLPRVTIRVGG